MGQSTTIFLCTRQFSAWWQINNQPNNWVILEQACSWPVRSHSFAKENFRFEKFCAGLFLGSHIIGRVISTHGKRYCAIQLSTDSSLIYWHNTEFTDIIQKLYKTFASLVLLSGSLSFASLPLGFSSFSPSSKVTINLITLNDTSLSFSS